MSELMLPVRVLVACKNNKQAEEIREIIDNEEENYIVFSSTDETFLDCLDQNAPDLVVVDESVLTDEIIQTILHKYPYRFAQRFFILTSLEGNLNLSLRLPFSFALERTNLNQELHIHLARYTKRRKWNLSEWNYIYDATRFYFNSMFLQMLSSRTPLESVNSEFGLTMKPGLFQMYIVKFDYLGDSREIYGHIAPLQKLIENAIYARLIHICHDMVICHTFDGVMATLNYAKENKAALIQATRSLHSEIREICLEFPGIIPTLCIGNAYEDITKLNASRFEAQHALWSRLYYGCGRIITKEDASKLQFPLTMSLKYDTLYSRFQKAFELLDLDEFNRCTDDFFDAPDTVLCCYQISDLMLQRILPLFFHIQSVHISHFDDTETVKNKVTYKLIMSPTLAKFKEVFSCEFTKLFLLILDHVSSRYSPYVQKAVTYIEDNYRHDISVSDIADIAGVTSGYLSFLFHKETGSSIISYITVFRIEKACVLLKTTDMPVAQVGEQVNIADSKYFSKQFKKYVGLSPLEYKKTVH